MSVLAASCGGTERPPPGSYDHLLALAPQLLVPNQPFELKVVGDGGGLVPELSVAEGTMPVGLSLQADGTISGTPTLAGELRRFTLAAKTADGEPLGTQAYALAVSVPSTNLPSSPTVQQTDDVLAFSGDWGKPLAMAYAFDPVWNLLWPLRAGAGVSGEALSSASGALVLVASGPDATGVFNVTANPSDARIGVITEVTWAGDADLDVRLLVDPKLGGQEVNAAAPEFDANGAWAAKVEGSSTTEPGPEVAVIAKNAPAGRYALMVSKAAGTEVKVPAWVSVRRADGQLLAESRFDLFLSDTAGASLADDVAQGRQSYGSVGLVTLDADGTVTYGEVARASDPFSAAPEGQ